MQPNKEFSNLKGIQDLANNMVDTKKDMVYPLVYCLVKLALILLGAATSVERFFSVMKILKNCSRNQIEDLWMNECSITYIKKDVFNNIGKEVCIIRIYLMYLFF
ncbi:hypothetical protein V6Z11_D10G112600 [Gossypium hirsutum]